MPKDGSAAAEPGVLQLKENIMWQVIIDDHVKFIPTKTVPSDIYWHQSVFKGYGEGITDVGGSQELAELCKLREVENIHAIVSRDPDYFYKTEGVTWVYTGRVGNAPDYLGFCNSNYVIGEVKWNDGWHKRLFDQISGYASETIWLSHTNNKKLEIFIACPQTASKKLISDLCTINPKIWEETHVNFGFIQLGWSNHDNKDCYMRVVWKTAKKWDGQGFEGSSDVGLH